MLASTFWKVLFAMALASSACTSDPSAEIGADAPIPESAQVDTSSEPAVPTDGPSRLIALLSTVPYEDSSAPMRMVDVDRAFASAGLDHDEACNAESGAEFFEMYQTANGTAGVMPRLFFDAPKTFTELPTAFGFAHCEVDSYLEFWGSSYLVYVDKDGQAVAEQAAQDPDWAESVAVSTSGDFTIVDWGDVIDPDRMTALRQAGGKLVISDHVVARVTRPVDVDRIVDPGAERKIDRPHVRSIVEELEARGAYSIVLTDQGESLDFRVAVRSDELDDATWDLVAASPRLGPWESLGYGASTSDDGDIAVVVIAHASTAEAEANADRFVSVINDGHDNRYGTAWSDRLALVNVETEGALLVATLVSVDEMSALSHVDFAHSDDNNLLTFPVDP